MKSGAMTVALALAVLVGGAPARGGDPWEGGYHSDDDDDTGNTLGVGSVQQHDLAEEPVGLDDQDWVVVPTLAGHSYEVRLNGADLPLAWGDSCPDCAQFERVDSAGTVLTGDVGTVIVGSGPNAAQSYDRSIRWIATADSVSDFVRVKGSPVVAEDARFVYTLRYYDTTYTVPRWNASGTQTTVFVLSSVVQAPVAAVVAFYDGTGTILHQLNVPLAPNSPVVFNTGSFAALAGRSGYALVAHTGGYGALSGKAVALEPSTGFTFDTPLQPIPQ
jgi:hypothetical protein